MTATPTPLRELIAHWRKVRVDGEHAEFCNGYECAMTAAADELEAALSARDAAGACECKGTGFIGQHLPNGDYEPDTWTCPKHTPPASGEAVNYFDVQRVADELGIDYNKLCTAIRRLAAVAPAAPGDEPTVERWSCQYGGGMDTDPNGDWVPYGDYKRLLDRLAAVAPAGMKWPERFACNGPQGTFWTDDAALANKLIAATFDRDDWTVTDVTAHPSEVEALERGRKAWADVPNAATWQREIRGLREHLRAALAARTGKGE